MPDVLTATPLLAIRAIALDTETTGLDVKTARMIEIAMLDARRPDAAPLVDTLLACAEPIPAAATAVHGIAAADLAGAPGFAAAHGGIAAALAGGVVVGHTIGFDIAMLRRECERAGLPALAPPALDVRILAQIVAPQLSSYSLEGLAAWLGVAVGARHRARGDAETAARIFTALIPLLREKGIRTFGEAQARCRMVTDAMSGVTPGDWELPSGRPSAGDAVEKLDHYPYSHRVRDVMNPAPVLVPPEMPTGEALRMLADKRISSVLVGTDLGSADTLGIVTERDLLRALARAGADAFAQPIGAVASRPLLTVPEDALIYRAIGRMANRNVRHLVALDADDGVAGVLTTRDLLKLRASAAIALGDDIDSAGDVATLAAAWAKLPGMARALLAEGVTARAVAAVIAREIGALTRRAAQLAESAMAAEGLGAAPCAYAVLVLGSAGRGESLLAMDQDNAVIFAEGEPDGEADRWFAEHGSRMTRILHEVGVPLCKGGVMASEPAFRGSLHEWRERVRRWLSRARPEDLLAVDIFFDFRAVHGRRALATELWREAWSAVATQTAFLKLLGEDAAGGGAYISLFGKIKGDEDGRIDVKGAVLKGVVTTARLLAMRRGVLKHATEERLAGLAGAGHGGADIAGLDGDQRLALALILRQQLADIAAGLPPSNRVALKSLSREEHDALKEALGRQSALGDILRAELSA
jgi:DNA polymerase-3 subunit epsilon/CBS domain-containing protein